MARLFATPADAFSRAIKLLEEALSEAKDDVLLGVMIPMLLSVYLLYAREWTRVMEVEQELFDSGKHDYLADPEALFRWALAYWAHCEEWDLSDEMPEQPCRLFVKYATAVIAAEEEGHAACCQALALTYWRLGDRARAKEYVQEALRRIDEYESPELSYWRCLQVSPEEFREDCRQIERLIDGEPLQPLFLTEPLRSEPGEPNTA